MSPFDQVNLNGRQPVLLAVLAHPDDETFGLGGTLALYSRRGVSTHLVCATHGEVGEASDELLKGFNSVAELRESELRCAAGLLGLAGVHFLGYRDSGMPGSPDNQHPQALVASPESEVVGQIVHYIRLLKPQVILTFDPIGGYRHPDHIAIHRATVKAFYAAGDAGQYPQDLPAYSPEKLYFYTISKTIVKIGVSLLRILGRDPHKFGQNQDVDLVSIASEEFPIHARINYKSVADIRAQAAACHASQGGVTMARGIQGWLMKLVGSNESYMRGYPELMKGKIERDLFEGLTTPRKQP